MRRVLPVIAGAMLAVLPGLPAGGQPPVTRSSAVTVDSIVSPQTLEAYAKAHVAINLLRDREQAELAEPRNKKLEPQAEVREKYRTEREKIRAAHGFTMDQYTRITQQISSDDAIRDRFEAAVAKLVPVK